MLSVVAIVVLLIVLGYSYVAYQDLLDYSQSLEEEIGDLYERHERTKDNFNRKLKGLEEYFDIKIDGIKQKDHIIYKSNVCNDDKSCEVNEAGEAEGE